MLASRVIHIYEGVPSLPQFKALDVLEKESEEQVVFSYTFESSQAGPVPVYVEEKIMQDSNVVWVSSQNIAVSQSTSLKRFGPVLGPGKYKLVVEASSGAEKARIVREFTVSAAALPIMPMAAMAGLALLLFAGMAIATKYIATS